MPATALRIFLLFVTFAAGVALAESGLVDLPSQAPEESVVESAPVEEVAVATLPEAPLPDPIVAGETVEATPVETPAPTVAPKPTSLTVSKPAVSKTGGLTLSAVAKEGYVDFDWSLTGGLTAPHGFKISKSTEPNPSYPDDEYQYVASPDGRSYRWSVGDGETYHFRVCTWNGAEDGTSACAVHSNDVEVTTIEKTSTTYSPGVEAVTSELSLGATSTANGISLGWTPSASSAFMAYKVVRSETDANLSYPSNGSIAYSSDIENTSYLDTTAIGGTAYYYRICAIESSGPVTCGNVVQVTR